MVLLVCALLAIGAVGFTLFVRERDIPPAAVENPELRHLERRRQVLYENLKDLQFEYHQGKLSDEDYQSLKAGFLYDLAGVMDAIERLEQKEGKRGPDAAGPKEKLKPEAAAVPSPGVCPACQGANPPASRFCGHCGKPLRQTP